MIDIFKDFSRLDFGSFKAFVAAAQTLNFTAAARRAAMTQSGVSQHVARLERQLSARLFDRAGKKVRLTRAGELLLKFCEAQKHGTDELFENVSSERNKLRGRVSYAMPYSCFFSPHFERLLSRKKELGEIDLEVRLVPNEAVVDLLLAGQIDFGFVTKKENNPALRFDFFCREEYILAGAPGFRLGRPATQEALLAEKFVNYPGMEVIFEIWTRRQFGREAFSLKSYKIGGFIDTLHGAIAMLRHGVGLAVIPRHCVSGLLSSGVLRQFPGPDKNPVLNDISIAASSRARLPARAAAVINVFREMKRG